MMKDNVWEGTTQVATGDGISSEGKCRLEKTDDGFIWTNIGVVNETTVERRSVSRRVR